MEITEIFISYRREGGGHLAGRIKDRIEDRYNVFFDRETLHSGKFNAQIIDAIKECDDVLVVLPPKRA